MPLKRITAQVETRRLGYLRLWRDDLEEMVRTIRKAVPDVTMTVDGDYRIDEVSDLEQYRKDKISSFLVDNRDTGVHLILSGSQAQMELKNPTLAVLGVATEIERIAATRRRPFVFVQGAKMALWIFIGLSIVNLWSFKAVPDSMPTRTDGSPALPYFFLGAAVMSVVAGSTLSMLMYGRRSGGGAVIFTKSQAEAPPWFKRNRDALVTNALVSLVFLVIGIVVGQLTAK